MIDTKEYISYIKSQFCLICGATPVDPDHLEARGMGNANKSGRKDFSCVPLCREHHSERHSYGNKKFEKLYHINLWKEAFRLIRRYYVD